MIKVCSNRNAVYDLYGESCRRHTLTLVVTLGLLLLFGSVFPAGAAVTDPEDLWTSEDIVHWMLQSQGGY